MIGFAVFCSHPDPASSPGEECIGSCWFIYSWTVCMLISDVDSSSLWVQWRDFVGFAPLNSRRFLGFRLLKKKLRTSQMGSLSQMAKLLSFADVERALTFKLSQQPLRGRGSLSGTDSWMLLWVRRWKKSTHFPSAKLSPLSNGKSSSSSSHRFLQISHSNPLSSRRILLQLCREIFLHLDGF